MAYKLNYALWLRIFYEIEIDCYTSINSYNTEYIYWIKSNQLINNLLKPNC